MSILARPDIRQSILDGRIVCDPTPAEEHIGPNSIDLHLGDELLVYQLAYGQAIDSRNPPATYSLPLSANGYWSLSPGQLYLSSTLESCGTSQESGLVPHLDGRSSLARLGVWAHLAAGRGDVGFVGHWTVELVAVHKTLIYPRSKMFQMSFHQTSIPWSPGVHEDADVYRGDYAGQEGPRKSRGIW